MTLQNKKHHKIGKTYNKGLHKWWEKMGKTKVKTLLINQNRDCLIQQIVLKKEQDIKGPIYYRVNKTII